MTTEDVWFNVKQSGLVAWIVAFDLVGFVLALGVLWVTLSHTPMGE
jgi:hypothetical protein